MGRYRKVARKVLSGVADTNISFFELCQLLLRLGFSRRIKGSHHIFTRADIAEIINLQPRNGVAKAYQVKQVRRILLAYDLGESDVD